MSFVPEFAPDAKSQWQELEFFWQELVLDEVERLAADPPEGFEHIAEFVVEHEGSRFILYLRTFTDHARRTLNVVGVGLIRADGS